MAKLLCRRCAGTGLSGIGLRACAFCEGEGVSERMPVVMLESPYAGDVERNTRYARACMLECLRRGEAPFASHLLYTQALDDADAQQRGLGMLAGHALLPVCDYVVAYVDYGVSPGMQERMRLAESLGVQVQRRKLGHGEA